MQTFCEMALPQRLIDSLTKMNFSTPTPVQAEAIPLALEGKDILGSAQTGTGKTGAFGIPLIAHLMKNPKSLGLVLTPTRELALQVLKQLHAILGEKSTVNTALLIGGEPMPKQFKQLKNRPQLVVGTPGRINDHLERGSLNLKHTDFLVLDETDRMLDMGFSIQIEAILKHMQAKRQTLLFSATFPKNITKLAESYLIDPVRVAVGGDSQPAANIKQDVVHIDEAKKYDNLLTQLGERSGSVIIFVKTKHGTEKLATRISKDGHRADVIHGDLRQTRRDRVIHGFRKQKYRVLVATDIAARGLDIPHIEHVINYDLPQCAEDFIHRIGRTARAGAEGAALTYISPSDKRKWFAIARLLDPNAKPERERDSFNKPRKKFQPKKPGFSAHAKTGKPLARKSRKKTFAAA